MTFSCVLIVNVGASALVAISQTWAAFYVGQKHNSYGSSCDVQRRDSVRHFYWTCRGTNSLIHWNTQQEGFESEQWPDLRWNRWSGFNWNGWLFRTEYVYVVSTNGL